MGLSIILFDLCVKENCTERERIERHRERRLRLPFATTWMDPEGIILNKSDRGAQIPYDTIYIYN